MLTSLVAAPLRAQVVESARTSQLSLQAGGMASIFQPDFNSWPNTSQYPIAGSSGSPMLGVGAFVDFSLNRWLGVEGEGRWQRFNKYKTVTETSYLIGPRLPVTRLGHFNIYAKALIGYAKMDFGIYGATGRFTATAFGGGADIKLTRKIYFRAVDFEYQYWPIWGDSSLKPYGLSSGIAYRIF